METLTLSAESKGTPVGSGAAVGRPELTAAADGEACGPADSAADDSEAGEVVLVVVGAVEVSVAGVSLHCCLVIRVCNDRIGG